MRARQVSRSENKAELYLSYKDHKTEPGKTRPIATWCSNNTLALSNTLQIKPKWRKKSNLQKDTSGWKRSLTERPRMMSKKTKTMYERRRG